MLRREIIRSDFECKYEGDRERKKTFGKRQREITRDYDNELAREFGEGDAMGDERTTELSLFLVSASDTT